MNTTYKGYLQKAREALRNAQLETGTDDNLYSKLDDLIYTVDDLIEGD